MIVFPDFYHDDTLELPAIAAMSSIAGAVILPWSTVFGVIVLIPCLLIALSWVWNGIRNTWLRFKWSRQFPLRMSCWRLRKLLLSKPKNIVVHVRYYGGFDVSRQCPASILEDCQTGDLTAIYPSSWNIPHWCDQYEILMKNA